MDTVSGLSAMKPVRTSHSLAYITCLHAYSLAQWSLCSRGSQTISKYVIFNGPSAHCRPTASYGLHYRCTKSCLLVHCPVRLFLAVAFKYYFQAVPRFLVDLRVCDSFSYSRNTWRAVKKAKVFFSFCSICVLTLHSIIVWK